MIRKVLLFTLFFFNISTFASTDVVSQYLPSHQKTACDPHAAISSASNFCATFPPAATCNCENHGMTPAFCSDMTNIYTAMMQTYHHNLADACNNPKAQTVSSTQECIDDWNCYWSGGISTTGKCNATGLACTTNPRPPL
jgi:hypothetical protein